MTSELRIDHVAIKVADLAAAITDYEALGFTVVPGGEHEAWGTHNALVAFQDDSYLELIAFKRPRAPVGRPMTKHNWARQLVADGRPAGRARFLAWEAPPEGLVDFAMLPSSIEQTIAEAARRGLRIDGPLPGDRLRPDGQRVAWQLGIPDGSDLPFLCGDVTPRSLRVPAGDARRHANGVVRIGELTIAVADIEHSRARYQALVGAESSAEGITAGAATIRLATDKDNDVQEHLKSRGEGPCHVRLVTEDPTSVGMMDVRLSHGARMESVTAE